MVSRDCSIVYLLISVDHLTMFYPTDLQGLLVVIQLANKVTMRLISCKYFTLCIGMCMFSVGDVISLRSCQRRVLLIAECFSWQCDFSRLWSAASVTDS